MKVCPFCAEEIKDEAIVCKHCGRDLNKDQIINQIEKSKLTNRVNEYISAGYMIVSSGEDRSILERRYPFSALLFFLLLIAGLIGGLIYGIYAANKRLRVQLFLNAEGTIMETGETLKVWKKRVLNRKQVFNILFLVIISLFIFMMLLGSFVGSSEFKKEDIVMLIVITLIFASIDFLLIKNTMSLSKKIAEISN